jgi:acetoin utilization deacetylase AcuC-like enzyme
MFVTYHPDYVIDIGPTHRFPMQKYGLVYQTLLAEHTLDPGQVVHPPPIRVDDLLLVHTRDYVERFLTGQMSPKEMRVLGFPWSLPLVHRARLAAHGTVMASIAALRQGLGINLAGGSHHAFADHGEGFSVFNDVAIAIRVLQRDHGLHRAAVIDCDVHQGNGTATIFAQDPTVYTCSLHGEKNYPFRKATSSLDIGLADGVDDAGYLAVLEAHLPAILRDFAPEMVWYVAGVDPYVGDTLGRLALTIAGLKQRDAYVLTACAKAHIPVVVTLGGGYAPAMAEIVEAHCNTVRMAMRVAQRLALHRQ